MSQYQTHEGVKHRVCAVHVRGVTKRYGNLQALAGIDLDIFAGEFFGLLGHNGAGKTTLISALAGLVRPDAGKLMVMGKDVVADYRAARRQLGVVPQELVFDPFFNVREMLRMQSGYFGLKNNDDWIDEILAHLDLTDKAEVNMRRLSGGMKRRVLVAQALVHRPPVIVLDEPTAGVDVELRQSLWQFIQKLNRDGHTIVLTTHYLEEAQTLCNRIAMMKSGRIVAMDTTENLLRNYTQRSLRFKTEQSARAQTIGARKVDGWWVLPWEDPTQIEPMLARLREAGIPVTDLALGAPDLEQVFVDVMHKS